MMTSSRLSKEAVLRIGEVSTVTGRRISVTVDREKNLSELFFYGDVLRNVAVGSYVDIRKGYLSLIGKVEGENAEFEAPYDQELVTHPSSKRIITISLVGYIDRTGKFYGGTKELPLVGNEAYLLTKEKVHQIHNLLDFDGIGLHIARSDYEGYEISLPVDGLINSHIAIFGNTGSGKSNTLAILFQSFIEEMKARNEDAFLKKCRVLVFDFNGEYTTNNCLTEDKKVYNLSTYNNDGNKIPLSRDGLLDMEMLSILADATEKTQKPFLTRVLRLHNRVMRDDQPLNYTRNILQQQVTQILQMSDKVKADLLVDYFRQILPEEDENGHRIELAADLDWHNIQKEFKYRNKFLKTNPENIPNTKIHQTAGGFNFKGDTLSDFITFMYIQLIYDVLSNRAQNEHISPVINKLKSKQSAIRKIFDPTDEGELFKKNVVVISLNNVNIEMKKTIPLLISKKVYREQKAFEQDHTLNIIVDEAHNILSRESFREAESWKDYRLETFEEIIKEGRKFGVFVTIASQRPNDISHTITSQAHNYFIHRLINQKDLQSISNAVSYIDKITEESIPTLPTGTCIFSGMAGQMPLKLNIKPLEDNLRPRSHTREFKSIIPSD
jgi:hypothetical protein